MSQEGFKCPSCGGVRSLVLNRRGRKRHRQCRDCGMRFKTVELTESEHAALQAEITALQALRVAVSHVVGK